MSFQISLGSQGFSGDSGYVGLAVWSHSMFLFSLWLHQFSRMLRCCFQGGDEGWILTFV